LLFNSFTFIFVYLPVVAIGFFGLARINQRLAAGWLTVASLAFYGWSDASNVALLLTSITFNYACGTRIARLHEAKRRTAAKRWLIFALAANLSLLGWFKYAIFVLGNLQHVTGQPLSLPEIVLPLGVSFFTFTQIAFLVDAYRGEVREYSFTHYALFVSYFPHLIAGPILHHREMMPQFRLAATYQPSAENLAVGISMFLIGLFKKTVIADDMATFATPAFDAAAAGAALTLLEAWGAALCYTFQIYFDFSGYIDMALGTSRMFGIVLPRNFNSPYKARSIIDFWRRWHITLSRFLRDYVYIPLGGNRRGGARRYVNLLATMLIGGLWHGAGWTFILWGALHGAYLMVNHGWHAVRRRFPFRTPMGGSALALVATFVAVVVAWVVFRAQDFDTAMRILRGMAGMNGVILPVQWQHGILGMLAGHGVSFADVAHFDRVRQVNWLVFLLAFCWLAPNTQQILAGHRPALVTPGYGTIEPARFLAWRPSRSWVAFLLVLGVMALLSIHRYSEFIYFRF
jgi:D-alanyl-lipoteichoic acid acyltransferase DltB (MBOAT superfamily)